jgi:Zn-dependent peptidase ImmA (M78 family)
MTGKIQRARSSEKIREEAEKVLIAHAIKRPPVPVEKLAALLGATVKYSPFEGELAGVLARDGSRTVIGVNSSHHSNRQRFTIAHECGHLLLHEGEAYVDKTFRVNWRDDVSSQAVDAHEIEANRFAAELLMPYKMLREDLQTHDIDLESEVAIKTLAKRYGVSLQAMTHRITNLLEERMNTRRK